jgi:hypothetical protein
VGVDLCSDPFSSLAARMLALGMEPCEPDVPSRLASALSLSFFLKRNAISDYTQPALRRQMMKESLAMPMRVSVDATGL